MGGYLVKSHSSHRSGTLPVSLQLRIDGQTDGLPQQKAEPQREPTAQPVTQLRRNGSCRPGEVGARQATQPSHRASACGMERITEGRQHRGDAEVCTLYSSKEGLKGRVILQLPQCHLASPSPWAVFTHHFWSEWESTPLPYLHVPPPRPCVYHTI